MNVEYERVFEPEWGVARREPSDVVAVDGTYYCWYTRVEDDDPAYPGAYGGTVWYATSPDGHVWTERGEALPAGGAGAWDEYGAFTSNVFVADGTYYLFYTGVPAPFSAEFEDATETAIGVATADAPEGPWTKRGRVLEPGESGAWDDFRVDDACVVEHRGEYLLYYKGATKFQDNWAAHTPHGLAVAEDPAGPYERSPYNPVYDRGHADALFPYGDGVGALVQGDGLWDSPDGRRFERRARIEGDPWAPGAFREADGVRWGLAQAQLERRPTAARTERTLYLVRFDCELPAP
jgi:beta-xylosidase